MSLVYSIVPPRRRKNRVRVNLYVINSLQGNSSWNNALDSAKATLMGFSMPKLDAFEDQKEGDVFHTYFPPTHIMRSGRGFWFGSIRRGRGPEITPQQIEEIHTVMRSFGLQEIPYQRLPDNARFFEFWNSPTKVKMSFENNTLKLFLYKDTSHIDRVSAITPIDVLSAMEENNLKLIRRSPLKFSAKPTTNWKILRGCIAVEITAPFIAEKSDIEMFKYYLSRHFSDIREASMRRKADGEYKLGPASGMVRGLRYGEEDELADLMAEFDPNEIGQKTEPKSYGHFTQQEWEEISDIFHPRTANEEHLADFYKESDGDGNYMSVQNIKEIQDMATFLAHKVHNGDTMEDWVEDKISSIRQMLSDLTRYYSNGEKKMKGLDQWKFANEEVDKGESAEGYFADIPYHRETREFAESGEDTNDPLIDPKAQKNTPPTPSEIEQDDDVKTLSRVKVEEESVKQDKKAFLLANWKCLGEE